MMNKLGISNSFIFWFIVINLFVFFVLDGLYGLQFVYIASFILGSIAQFITFMVSLEDDSGIEDDNVGGFIMRTIKYNPVLILFKKFNAYLDWQREIGLKICSKIYKKIIKFNKWLNGLNKKNV